MITDDVFPVPQRPLPVSTETMTPLFTCNHCGHETNIMKALKILQDTDAAYRTGESQALNAALDGSASAWQLQQLLSDANGSL